MKDIKLYTWRTCPYCQNALRVLGENGYEFENIDILDTPEKKEELTAKYGQHTVPYIFVDDELIGGNSDLMELIESGKFAEMVQ